MMDRDRPGRRIRIVPPGQGRMRHASGTRLMRALVVADLDLDTGRVSTVHRPPVGATPAEGVHVVAWLHGVPVGECTLAGDPEVGLRRVAQEADMHFRAAVDEHLLRDVLAAPGVPSPEGGDDHVVVAHPSPPVGAPDVAVAICTRDRPEDLRRCLAAVQALEGPVAEVLVIDNASSGRSTREVAESFPGVRCIREPRRGLDWARNRALLESRADVVAFTDDDVLVHPSWVQGVRRAFVEEPSAAVVTGLVLPAELATPAQVLFEARGGFGRGYARAWFSAAVRDGEVAARRLAWIGAAGTGANLAVRRLHVLGLGGFDTALDVGTATGGGGDLELLFRVVATGGSVVYEPSAVVRHRHRGSMAELTRQRRGDGSSSYSWWLGAGRGYEAHERRALRAAAVRWAVYHHVRRLVLSAVWPRIWPLGLALADAEGALDAVVRNSYRRARAAAEEEARLHPDEPQAPPLQTRGPARSSAVAAPARQCIEVEVRPGALAGGGIAARRAAVLDVAVRESGVDLGVVEVAAHGTPITDARVRWAVAQRFSTTITRRPADPT